MTELEKKKLKEILDDSKRIVFFGGAGVSTASGIPDFRSKDGLYNQKDVHFENFEPEYLLSKDCLIDNTSVFYEFYRQKLDVRGIEPNITHKVLAKMEEQGKLIGVVTQNIDGLHQKAGSKKVYEIHGTTYVNHCSKCKKEYPTNYIFDCKQEIPTCECGGLIRPDVTLYGESLPNDAVNKAVDALDHADCLIIAGTSLSVYPAASFIQYFHGKHIVIINRDFLDVPYMTQDDLQINENMSDTFEYINTII